MFSDLFKVSTWTKQYKASAHRDIPAMNKLSNWLTDNLPAADNMVSLVHGDFRIDNLVFHPTEVNLFGRKKRPCSSPRSKSRWSLQCLSYLDACDRRVGLGAVHHRPAAGRLGLLPYESPLASQHAAHCYQKLARSWRSVKDIGIIFRKAIFQVKQFRALDPWKRTKAKFQENLPFKNHIIHFLIEIKILEKKANTAFFITLNLNKVTLSWI